MKKKIFAMLLCIAMVLSLAACGGSSSSSSGGALDQAAASNSGSTSSGTSDLPTVNWKMGSTWGAGNVHFTVDKRFAEILSQLTNGGFTVTNYAEGELCSASQLFDYVQDDTIQCGGDWGGYWSGKIGRAHV